MPSIPQSLLWISLVVLWLFVLVPMLVSKRDAVRRTSDVALATRVLNSGAAARLIKRGRPAAGHRSDPDWRPEADDETTTTSTTTTTDDGRRRRRRRADRRRAVVSRSSPRRPSPTTSTSTSSTRIPPRCRSAPARRDRGRADRGRNRSDEAEAVAHRGPSPRTPTRTDDDEYEYVEDTSGLDPGRRGAPTSRRRRRSAAAASALRRPRPPPRSAPASTRFRKRVLIGDGADRWSRSAAAAFLVTPTAWWVMRHATAVTVLYLAYLRRQTRIEERVRRRRMQRMARSRLGVENTYDRDYDVVPSRLRRPGAVVLEIDDEDPMFEHLDYAPYAPEGTATCRAPAAQ